MCTVDQSLLVSDVEYLDWRCMLLKKSSSVEDVSSWTIYFMHLPPPLFQHSLTNIHRCHYVGGQWRSTWVGFELMYYPPCQLSCFNPFLHSNIIIDGPIARNLLQYECAYKPMTCCAREWIFTLRDTRKGNEREKRTVLITDTGRVNLYSNNNK